MFLSFNSRTERMEYGGTAFIELQFCRLPITKSIKKIVAVDSIKNWKDDSLYVYVDNIDEFYQEYSKIFTDGIYCNGKSGIVDTFGINYYSKEQISVIIERLKNLQPKDYENLIDWLQKAKEYNGFYILGI